MRVDISVESFRGGAFGASVGMQKTGYLYINHTFNFTEESALIKITYYKTNRKSRT